MKRLDGRQLRRFGLQLGLLAGIGLAFMIGSHEQAAEAGGLGCAVEEWCTFRRPNIMFVVDYSTSMNTAWDLENDLTRWEAAVAAIEQVTAPGGYLEFNARLALLRFGHDPDPGSPGTVIPGDNSGIVDGQALDVEWDTEENDFHECAGELIVEALAATPAPMLGADVGIESWTKGALDRAAAEIAQTKADHPDPDGFPQPFMIVLLTDSVWTSADGTMSQAPGSEDPAITAQELYDNQNVRTYVVAIGGDAQVEAAADELASAGGSGAALHVDAAEQLVPTLDDAAVELVDGYIEFECAAASPRVMILLDASSSMLNTSDGTMAGGPGETGWDQVRDALAGESSLFDLDFGVGAAEDYVHLGLAVFGQDAPAPGEQKLLVQYGPCLKDNFAWALDPMTSCEQPGCSDPWAGPPIDWTFKDGTEDPPGFLHPTQSHMPACEGANPWCLGSGTYTHLGLELIKDNQVQYQLAGLDSMAETRTSLYTDYINILITDGLYTGYSTDAQVQAELEQMSSAGIRTHVIGFGAAVDEPGAVAQLEAMADWGSGDYYDADNQAELEQALTNILESSLILDPCCAPFNLCDEPPDPTTGDGDGDPSTTGDGDGDGDPSTTGDGDGDPSTTSEGDGDPADGSGDEFDGSEGDTGASTETGDGPDLRIDDDGCSCRADADDDRRTLGAALSLLLLGCVRRRDRRR